MGDEMQARYHLLETETDTVRQRSTLNGDSYSGFNKSSWGERHKVIAICFIMAALNYSLRFNLSFAIVEMVRGPSTENETSFLSKKPSLSSPYHHAEICSSLEVGSTQIKNPNSTMSHISLEEFQDKSQNSVPKFNWDERDQGLILGSFFWGYVVCQIPSGLLAQKYGGKWIIAVAMLATGILSIGLPHAALLGGRDFVILVRILQGLAEGFVVPALVNLQAKWTPPEERARLAAMTYAGFPFGTAMTMLISGQVIPKYGWPAMFYIPGVLTIFLFLVWIRKIHASPQCHPSITAEELKYISSTVDSKSDDDHSQSHNTDVGKVPWKEIFRSFPVWVIFISQFCNAWGHNMLKSEGPKYLHSALHFNIHQNSYVAASPYFAQMVFAVFVGRLSDSFLENRRIGMLTARKICNTIGQWGVGLAFAGIIISGCNRIPAVVCYILSGMIGGAMEGGSYVNIIDISPNYAGVIEGVINSVSNVAGFGAPYLAGLILYHEPSILGWCYVFGVPVISSFIGNLMFLIGAEVKVQRWNDVKKTDRRKSKLETESNN